MEVYIEDVLIINFVLDYAMLYCSLKLNNVKIGFLRLSVSSFLGASFSLIPIKEYFVGFTFALKLIEGIILLLPLKIPKRKFVCCYISLLLSSFVLVGLLLGISILIDGSGFIEVVDVYYLCDRYPLFSQISSAISIMLLTAITVRYFKRIKMTKRWLCEVVVEIDSERSVVLSAFIDSGNMIYDDINSLPIPIINYFAIADLLKYPSFDRLPDIDAKTAGGSSKLKRIKIMSFKIKYNGEERLFSDIYGCVALRGFSEDFDVLISPEMLI